MKRSNIFIIVVVLIVLLAFAPAIYQHLTGAAIAPATSPALYSRICIDSDNGKNYDVKGVATFKRERYEDYCQKESNNLVEYYCYSLFRPPASILKNCEEDGKICKDGACVKPPEMPKEEVTYEGVLRMLNKCEFQDTSPGGLEQCDRFCERNDKICIGGGILFDGVGGLKTIKRFIPVPCSYEANLGKNDTLLCICCFPIHVAEAVPLPA